MSYAGFKPFVAMAMQHAHTEPHESIMHGNCSQCNCVQVHYQRPHGVYRALSLHSVTPSLSSRIISKLVHPFGAKLCHYSFIIGSCATLELLHHTACDSLTRIVEYEPMSCMADCVHVHPPTLPSFLRHTPSSDHTSPPLPHSACKHIPSVFHACALSHTILHTLSYKHALPRTQKNQSH